MARENKGSSMSSHEGKSPNKSSGEETSSLAARRARLRGSLAKTTAAEEPVAPAVSEPQPPANDPVTVEPNPVASAEPVSAPQTLPDPAPDPVPEPVPEPVMEPAAHVL